jgi:hypothetical protein
MTWIRENWNEDEAIDVRQWVIEAVRVSLSG